MCVQSGEPVIHDEIEDVDESMHAEPVAVVAEPVPVVAEPVEMVAQDTDEVLAANDKELDEPHVSQDDV